MAASQQAIWMVLLAGSVLMSVPLGRAWMLRRDPRVTAATSGLLGLACLLIATIYTSIGW
jgi:hypothetical protein